jgi:hypothetical protein
MMYLEYFLVLVIIILVYMVITKIIENKEGFKHIGDGFIADKPKYLHQNNRRKKTKFDKQEEQVIEATKATYKISAQSAKIVINMPYRILYRIGKFYVENIKPMTDFFISIASAFYNAIADSIFKPMYRQAKKMFFLWLNIMRNMPAYIKQTAAKIVNIISQISTFWLNMVKMMVKIPESGLMFAINAQDSVLSTMI